MADCRKCIFFRHWSLLSFTERRLAEEWVEKYRKGEKPLGYCNHYRRPVTYYTGRCPGYKPRQEYQPRSILEFIGGG